MSLPIHLRVNVVFGFLVGGIIGLASSFLFPPLPLRPFVADGVALKASRSLFFFVAVCLVMYWFIVERPKLTKIKKIHLKTRAESALQGLSQQGSSTDLLASSSSGPKTSAEGGDGDDLGTDPLQDLTSSIYEDTEEYFDSDVEEDVPQEGSRVEMVMDIAKMSVKAPKTILSKLKNLRHRDGEDDID